MSFLGILLEYINCLADFKCQSPRFLVFVQSNDAAYSSGSVRLRAVPYRVAHEFLRPLKCPQVFEEFALLVEKVSHLLNHEQTVWRLHFQLTRQ